MSFRPRPTGNLESRPPLLSSEAADSPRGDVDLVEFVSVGVCMRLLAGWLAFILGAPPTDRPTAAADVLPPSLPPAPSSALLLLWTKNESQSRLIEDIEKQYRVTRGMHFIFYNLPGIKPQLMRFVRRLHLVMNANNFDVRQIRLVHPFIIIK